MRWTWRQAGIAAVAVAGLAAGGAIVSSTSNPIAAEATSARSTSLLRIDGMTCAGCAIAVKMAAGKVEGVTRVEISPEDKQALVTFDPARTTPSAIARAIHEGTGFAAEPVSPLRD